jgi:hypothetical protein
VPERRPAARGTRSLETPLAALIASAALAAAAPALAQAPAEAPAPFVLQRLDLDLAVDYERGTVAGTATLRVRNLSPRPVGAVTLLLNRLMTVGGVTAEDGAPLPFAQRVVLFQDDSTLQVDAVTVTPRAPVAPGDSLAIAVRYGGVLVGYVETGSLYIRDHVSREFTILREDAFAFPVLGVASWRANRAAPREPFTFGARVTVPADLVVAMGGEPVERSARDSLVRWNYRSTAPVPFLNIAIAPYRVLERAGTRVFFFPADSLGARSVEQAIAGAVDRYGRWFGPLGEEARLTVMEIPEGYGSQASLAAGILQTADAFRDRAQLRQLYHELSHLWNVEDRERPSPRWNEGLASFLERRVAAELDGWSDWDSLLARVEQRLRRACTSDAGCGAMPFAAYGAAGKTDLSYSVGLAMFYALYRTLGAEAFDRAYRDFFQAHRGTGAVSQDLAAAFHRADPRSDAVFADWFTTTRWYARLVAGESLARIAESYRR